MSGQFSGQIFRTSPSSQPSLSSSSSNAQSEEGNRKGYAAKAIHVHHSTSDQNFNHDESSLPRESTQRASDQNQEVQDELGRRKQGMRHSGGFLLQPLPTSEYQNATAGQAAQGVYQDSKGKRRAEDIDFVLAKRRTHTRQHATKQLVGSSPLATEIFNASPAQTIGVGDKPELGENLSITSVPNSVFRNSSHSVNDHDAEKNISSVNAHGTDPTQIINLALNLSENRRRNFSTGGIPLANVGNRRIPSLGQHALGSPKNVFTTTNGGGLRQYLQQQRNSSRNVSPRSNPARDGEVSFSPSTRRFESSSKSTNHGDVNSVSLDKSTFNASEATLARAKEAKIFFELFYEYRRLLQSLPIIPLRSQAKPVLNRVAAKSGSETSQDLGRAYNPLQYVRNRRVRARERKMFDAEADGWKNVDAVRNWVNIIKNEGEARTTIAVDHFVLPPFRTNLMNPGSGDCFLEPGSLTPTVPVTNRLRRPRLDWSFTPWDLLADAYWLHSDNNLRQIEDSDGKKIFSGKRLNQETSSRISQEASPVVQSRRSQSITRQTLAPEKIQSIFGHSRNNSTERGRRRHQLQESKSSMPNGNGSRDRKSRWPRYPIRSRSSSSSSISMEDEMQSQLRESGFSVTRDHPESAALEKQMRDILKQEAESRMSHELPIVRREQAKSLRFRSNNSNNPNTEGAPPYVKTQPTAALPEVQHHHSTPDRAGHSTKTSIDEQTSSKLRYTFEELENHVSRSSHPHVYGHGLATDLSPSATQSVTPSERSMPWKSTSPQAPDKKRLSIDMKDLEMKLLEHNVLPSLESTESTAGVTPYKERVSHFGSGLHIHNATEAFSKKIRRLDGTFTKSPKDSFNNDSRFRGFFKGGRIAELVGNEVHKVGDKLWKKDGSNNLSRVSTAKSGYASDESDLELDLSGWDSSPDNRLSRKTTNNEEIVESPQVPAATERPRYHHKRLPSFKSAFPRDGQLAGPSNGSLHHDHITRQQAALRARGRSSRFDRLAPPKINVENISRSPSPPMISQQTQEADTTSGKSHQNRDSRSDYQVSAADRRLNSVLGISGTVDFSEPPVSLLSKLESRRGRGSSGPNAEGQRHWSISDRGISAAHGAATKREIARVRALLLSSGVKANEIVRRWQEVPDVPLAILQDLQKASHEPLPLVPRSQEHRFTARMLNSKIEASHQQLRAAAEHFADNTVEALHRQMRAINEHISHQLIPSVRRCADTADAFSTELITTHTLAVKQVNDSIDIMLRRRRRRFRWLRRGGYALLEWILLGIMWWVWFIVVIIRLIRGMVRASVSSLKWLFWL